MLVGLDPATVVRVGVVGPFDGFVIFFIFMGSPSGGMASAPLLSSVRDLFSVLPGFSPNCPKRNVLASLVYLDLGLVVLSLPLMV